MNSKIHTQTWINTCWLLFNVPSDHTSKSLFCSFIYPYTKGGNTQYNHSLICPQRYINAWTHFAKTVHLCGLTAPYSLWNSLFQRQSYTTQLKTCELFLVPFCVICRHHFFPQKHAVSSYGCSISASYYCLSALIKSFSSIPMSLGFMGDGAHLAAYRSTLGTFTVLR